jgi:hypothetical protein
MSTSRFTEPEDFEGAQKGVVSQRSGVSKNIVGIAADEVEHVGVYVVE